MKENTFYKDKKFEYPEIAILMDNFIDNKRRTARFVIPILTPNFNNERLSISEKPRIDTSNIVNQNTNNITSVTEQNFVTLTIPEYMFSNGIHYNKGDKFIVVFIGGDVNRIQIIGVC